MIFDSIHSTVANFPKPCPRKFLAWPLKISSTIEARLRWQRYGSCIPQSSPCNRGTKLKGRDADRSPDRFEQFLENIHRHTSGKTYLRRSGPKGDSTSASVLGTTGCLCLVQEIWYRLTLSVPTFEGTLRAILSDEAFRVVPRCVLLNSRRHLPC